MKRLLTTDEVIERGWTENMVKRLLKPDQIEAYRACGWDVTRRHYALRQVSAVERSKAFKAARERSEKAIRARAPEAVQWPSAAQIARFERKYGGVDAALPDACDAMFNLNRCAKHDSCTRDHAREIYRLKHKLVHLLHALGFCVGCQEHNVPGKKCYRCNGTGDDPYDWQYQPEGEDDDCEGGGCVGCRGSGYYVEPSVLVMFHFSVAGRTFVWHVPADDVRFRYAITAEAAAWDSRTEEKPVALSSSGFARAKALVCWVVEGKKAAVALKERMANNFAYVPPVHRHHGQTLREKLARLGHPSPDDAENAIRRGAVSALEVFRKLGEAKLAEFKQRIAEQLAYRPPLPNRHGQSLREKLFASIPKGTPYRTTLAEQGCADIRSGKRSYSEALTRLRLSAAGTTQQS